jgi:hypothetical protein
LVSRYAGNIKEFDPNLGGTSTLAPSGKKGFFFADQPATAGEYSNLASERSSIRVKQLSKEFNELESWNPGGIPSLEEWLKYDDRLSPERKTRSGIEHKKLKQNFVKLLKKMEGAYFSWRSRQSDYLPGPFEDRKTVHP